MYFTALFAVSALLLLFIIFAVTYKAKGLKTAFITTGIAFVVFSVLLVATINAIVSIMSN